MPSTPLQVTRTQPQPRQRDWFLQHCQWTDACWIFAPTSLLEEEHPVRIRWDFALPSSGQFTDSPHAALLESSRRLLALIRSRSVTTGRSQRAATVRVLFIRLRHLLIWMDGEGFARFADIDRGGLLRFHRITLLRRNRQGTAIARTTVELTLRVLLYLHRY